MPASKYYNNEKPLFHSSMASHGSLNLYLDFNKKDLLQGLYFTSESDSPWLTQLETMAKELEGKNFLELQTLKEIPPVEGFFDLPHYLLHEALSTYRGKAPALYELKNQPENDLICRCFGIYKEELLEVLDTHPEYSRQELTNATKAGAGCTTCLSNFSEVLAEAKSRQAQKLLNN